MAISSVVLKTISENSKDGKTWGQWVIQYFMDEKSISVKVVCGEKKMKEDGSIWYIAKGMSTRDFQALKPHYQEFVALTNTPPEFPSAKPAAPAAEIEEVPF